MIKTTKQKQSRAPRDSQCDTISVADATTQACIFRQEHQYQDKLLIIEVGKWAFNTDASVRVSLGKTTVLCTVVTKKTAATRSLEQSSFLNLSVQYQERFCSTGRIPHSVMKRETRQNNREILISRMIDRTLRPLIPAYYEHEIQVLCTLMAGDDYLITDVVSLIASSIAMSISSVPFVDVFGTYKSILNEESYSVGHANISESYTLLVTGLADSIIMIEGNFNEMPTPELAEELANAQKHIKALIEILKKFTSGYKAETSTKQKMLSEKKDWSIAWEEEQHDNALKYQAFFRKRFDAIQNCEDAKGAITDSVEYILSKSKEAMSNATAFGLVSRALMHYMIDQSNRFDERKFDQIRMIECCVDSSLNAIIHGNALFTRFNSTQVLSLVTVGGNVNPNDYETEYTVFGAKSKRCMLYYNFWPFAVNEIGQPNKNSRREIGHSELARKAILPILATRQSIRITSEVLACAGSSSMASVCSASVALKNAESKCANALIRKHAAGIALGALKAKTSDYLIAVDINPIEDQCGLMDFKIAATRDGITALQLDVKEPHGFKVKFLVKALKVAENNIAVILDIMEKAAPIGEYRENPDESSTRQGSHQGSNQSSNQNSGQNSSQGGNRDNRRFEKNLDKSDIPSGKSEAQNNFSKKELYSETEVENLISTKISLSEEKIKFLEKNNEQIKNIEQNTSSKIEFMDSSIRISSYKQANVDNAIQMIFQNTQPASPVSVNIEIGAPYEGKITKIVQYGLFIRIANAEGLLHISELGFGHSDNLQNFFHVNQIIKVSVIQIEKNGKLRLAYCDTIAGVPGIGGTNSGNYNTSSSSSAGNQEQQEHTVGVKKTTTSQQTKTKRFW